MITILLVNLIGVTIYVAGIGLCLRTTRRTGNQGYLLLAAYFAAVLVVSSMEQVKRMQAGPATGEGAALELPKPEAEDKAEEAPQGSGDSSVPADGLLGPQEVADSPWESVSPPILPALLLAGVFLVGRDDPRRAGEDAETDGDAADGSLPSENGVEPGAANQA